MVFLSSLAHKELRMRKNHETLGLRMELAGLIILFVATFWQAEFSGWWDNELPEWQYLIQEGVNLEVLGVLAQISSLTAIEEPEERKQKAYETSTRAKQAISNAIEMRDERCKARKAQASLFSTISLVLALTGAFLLILGKYISVRAASTSDK